VSARSRFIGRRAVIKALLANQRHRAASDSRLASMDFVDVVLLCIAATVVASLPRMSRLADRWSS
jgi:hypothetical protein